MVQLIPQESLVDMLGAQIGSQVGTGIQSGIAGALEGYQKRKESEKQSLALRNLGLDIPEGFPLLPEKIQSAVIQDQLFNKLFGQTQQSPINQENDSIQSNISPSIQNRGGFSNLSDDALIRATANPIYKEAAKAELDRRNIQLKATTASEVKRADKFLDQINDSRNAVQRSESSLQAAQEALEKRELGFFSRDNLAEILHIPGLASPEGAVFNAAAKNFFLADLESAVGRPNQFLEKILQNAIFSNGKSNEANQALIDFYKNQVDLQREKINVTDNLEDYYRSKGLPVPGNIGRLVDQQLKTFAIKKEKELMEKYKDSTLNNQSISKSKLIRMIDPAGNLRDVPKEQAKKAQEAGYKLQK